MAKQRIYAIFQRFFRYNILFPLIHPSNIASQNGIRMLLLQFFIIVILAK